MSDQPRTERDVAADRLQRTWDRSADCIVIHYACEPIAKPATERAILAMVVKRLEDGHIEEFCTGAAGRDEAAVLAAFDHFVRAHPGCLWLHWNMRDSGFGFRAIEERAAAMGVPTAIIPTAHRLDLSATLCAVYGEDYIESDGAGRWPNLAALNGVSVDGWLAGTDEPAVWRERPHAVRRSVLRKVEALHALFTKTGRGTLKTKAVREEEAAGELLSVTQWALLSGVSPSTATRRAQKGLRLTKATADAARAERDGRRRPQESNAVVERKLRETSRR